MNSLVAYDESSEDESSDELANTKDTDRSTQSSANEIKAKQDEKNTPNEDEDESNELIGPPVPSFVDENPTSPSIPSSSNNDNSNQEEQNTLDEDDSDELIGPPIPMFEIDRNPGPSTQTEELIGPPIPEHEEDGSEDESFDLPIARNVSFTHGSKAVTALAIDPTGTRFVTGSLDYEMRFWDFAGMDSTLKSFRSIYPVGNYPIKALSFSATGDRILIISGMAQAKVHDRDGHEILETVKGDQYISDMSKTKGHTSPLTDGCWHPRIREEFLTSCEDSTCRVWNVFKPLQHKGIIKCRAKNGLKTTPTTCAYSRDGNFIACVCQDGSFQLWDTRKMFVNASKMIRDAHQFGTDTSRIAFSYSGYLMCTRGGDDTMKLWDIRMFKNAVRTATGLFSRYGSTDAMFNPQDSVIITGVSLEKGEKEGKLLFYDVNTFNRIEEIEVTDSHVIKAHWHPKLHQIFVGCGNGLVKVFYGEQSTKGATLCANRRTAKTRQIETVSYQQVITPHALPMFRQDRPKSIRKQMEKDRLDPVKSRRPDLPIKSGQGGRVASAGSTLSSYVIRNLGLSKRVEDDQDPREAILKYAKEAAENPYWVSPAYSKTQPKPIFMKEETNEGSDEPEEKRKKV
ncbi:gastrulation defective protein 1 homolog [Planococcus citri]|uniref:gastrulation defective protein 1 homolog n=1 Tax=Planococcus citri TaxID=170843 RepID=UPI0031F94BB0